MSRPRTGCDIAKSNHPINTETCRATRDELGNITFSKWTVGVGSQDWCKPNFRDLKKLRDWLTQVIDYVERPVPKAKGKK